jgi:hypothetical protein
LEFRSILSHFGTELKTTKRTYMSQASTLITGAGVNTIIGPNSQLESNIVIGDVDTAMPLQGLKVVVDGKTKIDIQGSQPLVSTFAKFAQLITGTVIGMVLKIATGRIYKTSTVTLTNNGATVPAIFTYSDSSNGVPLEAVTQGINPLSNETFKDFSGLFITPAANVASFDVVFDDGTSQNMSVIEADAMFSQTSQTEVNGRLDALVTGFDNRSRNISAVKVNATTAVTVMLVKLPQDYFNNTQK